MEVLRKFCHIVTKTNVMMRNILIIFLFFMAFVLAYATLARFFFSSPPVWSFDMASWLTGVVAFLGGGYALAYGAHVRVDLFWAKLSDRGKSLIDLITALLLFLVAGVLIWKGFGQVSSYFSSGATATTGLNIPLWIKVIVMPLGGVLIFLQGIVEWINDFSIVVTGKRFYEKEAE